MYIIGVHICHRGTYMSKGHIYVMRTHVCYGAHTCHWDTYMSCIQHKASSTLSGDWGSLRNSIVFFFSVFLPIADVFIVKYFHYF